MPLDPGSVRITQNDSTTQTGDQQLDPGVRRREELLTIGDALKRR